MNRKWIFPCGLISCILFLCGVICAGALLIGIDGLLSSLHTPQPDPTLISGNNYWVGALLPPFGLPAGLVITDIDIYNKPGEMINDPSVTIIGTLNDATPVKLIDIQEDWCYIEANDLSGKLIEGWMDCMYLLDYEPTPFPTPNKTPERP